MGNLVSALVLFSTVVTAVALGIGAAYGSLVVILQAFGNQREATIPASRNIAVSVLVASESQASGD